MLRWHGRKPLPKLKVGNVTGEVYEEASSKFSDDRTDRPYLGSVTIDFSFLTCIVLIHYPKISLHFECLFLVEIPFLIISGCNLQTNISIIFLSHADADK